MNLSRYPSSAQTFDELLTPTRRARPGLAPLVTLLRKAKFKDLDTIQKDAEVSIRSMGITFTVYSEGENIDREWPFDIIPRIIRAAEWEIVENGLKQRLTALNMFINDIYNDKAIIKDNIIPESLLKSSTNYRKECEGVRPAFGTWAHVCGTDLIKDANGEFFVLEDNLRVPSGVSYMLENRNLTKRVFPQLFEQFNVRPIDDYPAQLFDTLCEISPNSETPQVVVLTPGIFNSAYFEHAFLAQRMGAELVEGSDLIVEDDDRVFMKTVEGLRQVDVIYRRIDDQFLDPDVFRKDSVLGVPGLMRAWQAGTLALANAPGAGVADDKVVYTYVPDMIRYYLDEPPLINNIPSYRCEDPEQRQYVLDNIRDLVVKPANESGGYGLFIGPKETKHRAREIAQAIRRDPRNYMAQPMINLSTVPILCDRRIEPRHVDLRPFVLQGKETYVTTGGLTRVAMERGSLVVNSSQGGGSKDTWIAGES